MAVYKIKTAYLHNPLFVNGRNCGSTIETSKIVGLKMAFDESTKKLLCEVNGVLAVAPETDVAHMVPEGLGTIADYLAFFGMDVGLAASLSVSADSVKLSVKKEPLKAKQPVTAQVSEPTGNPTLTRGNK